MDPVLASLLSIVLTGLFSLGTIVTTYYFGPEARKAHLRQHEQQYAHEDEIREESRRNQDKERRRSRQFDEEEDDSET